MNHAFPAERRLHNAHEFDAVFKQNQFRIGCAEFLLLAGKGSAQICRLGMVVSKKTAGIAVQRNRIKRQIRESFRTCCETNSPAEAMDIVILTRKGVAQRDNAQLAMILSGLWQQLAKKMQTAGAR